MAGCRWEPALQHIPCYNWQSRCLCCANSVVPYNVATDLQALRRHKWFLLFHYPRFPRLLISGGLYSVQHFLVYHTCGFVEVSNSKLCAFCYDAESCRRVQVEGSRRVPTE